MMSNIPKLRFPEFTGEWEEKTFGDILSLNMVPVPKPDTEYERLGIFCHNKGTFHEHITDPSYIALDTLYKVHKNNFIVNITFAWEHAIAITTQNDEDALVTFRFLMFSFNKGYYHQFFKYAFSKEKFRYDLNVASPGGAGRNRVLNQKQLNNINLIVPSISEQEKIADFLSNVDSIITAETKILNALQKKKKALMQKLFTRQLRFKSDDGKDFPSWEEKKLGEISSSPKYGLNASGIDYDGEHKYLRITDIDEVTHTFSPEEITTPSEFSDDYLLEENDIVFARTGASTGKTYLYNPNDGDLYFAGFLIKFHIKDANARFVFYQTCTHEYEKWVHIMSTRSGQPGINSEEYSTLKIKLPCIEEQQKIANCLSSMDSLIQNQQKVVTTWQQRKKALLQQMFI